jgi:hypothetical protein
MALGNRAGMPPPAREGLLAGKQHEVPRGASGTRLAESYYPASGASRVRLTGQWSEPSTSE